MNNKSNILLLGHRGFVGRNLYSQLIEKKLTIHTTRINLLNQAEVKELFNKIKPDYVFMCAAKVGGIKANMNNNYSFLYENLQIQNNIIQSAIENKVKKVLFLGSACIYPTNYEQPLREEYLMAAPLEETNEGYALAKIAGLKLCEFANRQFKTKFISLMPCGIYGIGDNFADDNSHVIPALIRKIYYAKMHNKKHVEIWGSGDVKREFMYVSDLINCMIWAIDNIKINTFVNVGTGQETSIYQLALMIANILKYKGRFIFDKSKPDGMRRRLLDITRINKLGWKAKITLTDGLVQTIKYYKVLYDQISK